MGEHNKIKSDSMRNQDILPLIEKESAGWNFGARNLLCPVCGDSYNHVEPPYLKDAGDNYDANWGGRGDLAIIPIWGECGSRWEVCVGFHKGESSIFVRINNSCETHK